MSAALTVRRVPTRPLDGQKTGTSGLRKKTAVFMQPHFLQNWVQSLFNAVGETLRGGTLVLGGDGRYFNREAAQIILCMACANGVSKVLVGHNGLMPTPAVSAVIRRRGAQGGIIMTASHNPGGRDNDWGIKYNTANGAPAPESLTDRIYQHTLSITEYAEVDLPPIDLGKIGAQTFGGFEVEVIDSTADYVAMQREVFDFDAIGRFVARPDFSMMADSLHGVAGVVTKAVLVDLLGLPESALRHQEPLEDFGGLHPDPNLTYAHDLVEAMFSKDGSAPFFGVAADGDGDRNMILGRGVFVGPSDSLAIIADKAHLCIPRFSGGLRGVARSMPTSCAVDRVAKHLGIPVYQVPTGWKFFCNLMDDARISLCGEESFGTGCDMIREKDFGFALLSWLSILAYENRDVPVGGSMVTVQDIVNQHFAQYGRSYYTRYDYEECESAAANAMMAALDVASRSGEMEGRTAGAYTVRRVEQFRYEDPVDGSVADKQGIIISFTDGSRVVFRISGTGSVGATIRMYLEKYEGPAGNHQHDACEYTRSLADAALELSELAKHTGRTSPSVVT